MKTLPVRDERTIGPESPAEEEFDAFDMDEADHERHLARNNRNKALDRQSRKRRRCNEDRSLL